MVLLNVNSFVKYNQTSYGDIISRALVNCNKTIYPINNRSKKKQKKTKKTRNATTTLFCNFVDDEHCAMQHESPYVVLNNAYVYISSHNHHI